MTPRVLKLLITVLLAATAGLIILVIAEIGAPDPEPLPGPRLSIVWAVTSL